MEGEKASQESENPPLKTQKGVEGTHWALTCRYLTGDGRVEEQESQDEGGKCIHVQGRQRCVLSGSAGEKSLLAACAAPSAPVPARLWALGSGWLVRLWWGTRPPHSLSSLRVLCSLPAGSRGRDTLFHAE